MSKTRPPMIAIVMAQFSDYDSDKIKHQQNAAMNKYALSPQFGKVVGNAGGIPCAVGYDEITAQHASDVFDGLLLVGADTGTPDSWYVNGEKSPHPATGRVDFERRMIDEFSLAQKPILGICHGMQHIACHFGAKMTADVHAHHNTSIVHRSPAIPAQLGHHDIEVVSGTTLGDIFGVNGNPFHLEVNSFHNEAVVEPGSNVIVSARASDQVIEAIEVPLYPGVFIVGKQWHQEFAPDNHEAHKIFKRFVEVADERRLVLGMA